MIYLVTLFEILHRGFMFGYFKITKILPTLYYVFCTCRVHSTIAGYLKYTNQNASISILVSHSH